MKVTKFVPGSGCKKWLRAAVPAQAEAVRADLAGCGFGGAEADAPADGDGERSDSVQLGEGLHNLVSHIMAVTLMQAAQGASEQCKLRSARVLSASDVREGALSAFPGLGRFMRHVDRDSPEAAAFLPPAAPLSDEA